MFSVNSIVLLSNVIQKEPGIIVGPISFILGIILNFIYNMVYAITQPNSLGISIIFLTIVTRVLMLPLAFKQQKSMELMQKIQPEIKRIQDKYKDASTDPEVQRKMGAEMQKLYSKHKYNPFSGCLPMFIQLPIFIALSYIMQNPYLFIDIIGNIYNEAASLIMQIPDFVDAIRPLAVPKVPKGMTIDITVIADLEKVLNKFTVSDWEAIRAMVPANLSGSLTQLLDTKNSIEYFCGMNLVDRVGFGFPNIIIPIASGITTYFSSWLITKRTVVTDQAMRTQQKVMNIVMPLFMVYITTGLPGGVGLYWITSNLFQIIQQLLLNRHYDHKESIENKGDSR